MMATVDFERGGYAFIKGVFQYSAGVARRVNQLVIECQEVRNAVFALGGAASC